MEKEEMNARIANITYPKGGVSCFADSFVVTESSVLRRKFSDKKPCLSIAENRYPPHKTNPTNPRKTGLSRFFYNL